MTRNILRTLFDWIRRRRPGAFPAGRAFRRPLALAALPGRPPGAEGHRRPGGPGARGAGGARPRGSEPRRLPRRERRSHPDAGRGRSRPGGAGAGNRRRAAGGGGLLPDSGPLGACGRPGDPAAGVRRRSTVGMRRPPIPRAWSTGSALGLSTRPGLSSPASFTGSWRRCARGRRRSWWRECPGPSSSTSKGTTPATSRSLSGSRWCGAPETGSSKACRRTSRSFAGAVGSPLLRFERLVLGRWTRTQVVIAYIHGLAKEELVQEVRRRLSAIDADGIIDTSYIEEFIEDTPYTVFPQVLNTERPDTVVAHLLEGRVAILADGSPFALIVPTSFWAPDKRRRGLLPAVGRRDAGPPSAVRAGGPRRAPPLHVRRRDHLSPGNAPGPHAHQHRRRPGKRCPSRRLRKCS